MQFETLEQKTLHDGSTVSLIRKLIPQEIRIDVGIPQTYEYSIHCRAQEGVTCNTSLVASWYLGEDVLRCMYRAIQTTPDYDRIAQILKKISSKEDAEKLMAISDFPLARVLPIAPNSKVSLAHIPPISHRSEHMFS